MTTSHRRNTAKAIELCNKGVDLVLAEEYEAAINVLRSALQLIKKALLEDDDDTPIASHISLDDCVTLSSVSAMSSPPQNGCNPIMNARRKEDSQSSPTFMHRNPITLPFCMEDNTSSDVSIPIAIIFNLALAHQLAYDHCSTNRSGWPTKAGKLYEYVQEFLPRLRTPQVRFMMVIVNNLGLVYRELDEVDKSKQCFQELLEMLVAYMQRGCDRADFDKLEGFFNNASFLFCKE